MKRLLIVLLVGTTLAGCMVEENIDRVDAPELKAGHQYAFQVSGSSEAFAEVKVNGQVMATDEDQQPIPVSPFMHYEILTDNAVVDGQKFYLATAAVDPSNPIAPGGTSAFAIRHSDLASAFATTTGNAVSLLGFDSNVNLLNFPLTQDKSWSYDLENSAADDGLVGDITMKAQVRGQESVTTPAGKFSAIKVTSKGTYPDMSSLLAEEVADFESAGFTDVTISLDVDVSITDWYAPSVKAVVKESSRVFVDMTISFKDGSDKYDLAMTGESTMAVELTGARLGVTTDLGESGAIDAIVRGRAPMDPTGDVKTLAKPIFITINATASEVNAADAEVVHFVISTDGAPADMVVGYQVVDASGDILEQGDGESFNYIFDEAGVFYVNGLVKDADDWVPAMATTPVVADFQATMQATCQPASLWTVASCTPISVPLHPGVATAMVSWDAKTAGLVGEPGTASMTRGTDVAFTMDSNTGTGTFTGSTAPFQFDGRAWDFNWEATAGALEEVTFDIHIDYEGPASEPAGMEMNPARMMVTLLELAEIEL